MMYISILIMFKYGQKQMIKPRILQHQQKKDVVCQDLPMHLRHDLGIQKKGKEVGKKRTNLVFVAI
uniref:Uncharacterized protein n=1 Tax=uncultured gamma proteobacterium HF0010_26J14 TaxID=723564 RepID=E7C1V6_9GAMM|nr:hypothetical protein [uncultured gamma proteobacterium HF0010_26J14]